QLDRESNMYAVPKKEIPWEKARQIDTIFEDIAMHDTSFRITLASLVKEIQIHVKGHTSEESRTYDLENIYSLLVNKLVDDKSMLRGGNEVFTYFLKSILVRLYGESAIEEVSGFALKDGAVIDALPHTQIRLRVPARSEFPEESIDCLVDLD